MYDIRIDDKLQTSSMCIIFLQLALLIHSDLKRVDFTKHNCAHRKSYKSFKDKHIQWDGNESSWLPKLITALLHPSVGLHTTVLMAFFFFFTVHLPWVKSLDLHKKVHTKKAEALSEHITHCVLPCCLFLFNVHFKFCKKPYLFTILTRALPSTGTSPFQR